MYISRARQWTPIQMYHLASYTVVSVPLSIAFCISSIFFLLKLTLLFFSKTKNDKTNIFVTSNNFSIKLRSFLCVFSFFFSNVCVFCEVSVLLCVYVALYMRFLLYINNVLLFFVKCFFFFVNYTFFFN